MPCTYINYHHLYRPTMDVKAEPIACVFEIEVEGTVGIRSFSVCTQTEQAMSRIHRDLGSSCGYKDGMPDDHSQVHRLMGNLNNMAGKRHYHFCNPGADYKVALKFLTVLTKHGLVNSQFSNKLIGQFVKMQKGG